MKSPFTGGEVREISETRIVHFRGENYEYTHLCYECLDTKELFTTQEMDLVNTRQVYNQYREKYGIPFPDEIKETRAKYHLSASKMSQVLGFGENQYRLYENGDMPSVVNGRVLRSIEDPVTFMGYLESAKNTLGEQEYEKIKQNIECCENSEIEYLIKDLIFCGNRRDAYNGYAMQSVSKLKNIMLYYINKFGGVFVTKMNKLLFYTDFMSYKKYGEGMTGLSYRAIQHGPVPERWDKAYSLIDDIQTILVDCGNGIYGQKLTSVMSFDETCFTKEQKELLDTIHNAFKNETSNSISTRSHKENAWKENKDTHSYIDYKYAFSLKKIC